MLRFALTRFIEMIVLLLIMSFIIYGLIGLMPGDPIDERITSNPELTSADIAQLKALHGLDKPVIERYGHWLSSAVQGDFGFSRIHAKPALTVMFPYLVNTLILMSSAIGLALTVSIPIGIFVAVKPNSWFDYIINFLCFAGISIPPFWLALLVMIIFSVTLGWLPASGMGTIGDDSLADILKHMLLPVSVLAVHSVGSYVRFIRASTIQVMRLDFIRTARAKGLSQTSVVLRHALRNALLPFITVVALSFGSLFSGALVTETMFSWRGIGKMIFDSVLGNDFNLALVGLLFATFMTLLGNILVDLAYAAIDPRISLDTGSGSR
ncbi:MAG: diguanylate cyclase [Rhodospirillaceae bacterium TMED8]|nr:diguanylate cyclase [Magnetovibrio sp.]OUT49061.1 MAG: diguanylate cyclase [Rhodospirillaceae bacterium TMED8]|tara:strand:+ start:1303 stop:2274 length:972 start_codon:yes stop_codon:yes gene_type:complete